VERGWINYPLFAHEDPLLVGLRDDARFKALIDPLQRQWEAANHSVST
jgi:hypothetical protein